MDDRNIGRRNWMRIVGGAAAGTAMLAGAGPALAASAPAPQGKGLAALPWPYQPLDPDATAQRGFAGYAKGHCMYGTFEAIVGQTAEKLGAAYAGFPYEMFVYGAGGVAGWATLCGALNGAAAAFQVLSANPEPLVDALFRWYEKTALPDFLPAGMKFKNVASVAGSPLCHQSIANWCKASGKKAFSPERKERCGVLTAAVTRQAVILLNAQAAQKPLPVIADQATQDCMSCHEKGGTLENTRTKMACGGCHFALGTKHPDL